MRRQGKRIVCVLLTAVLLAGCGSGGAGAAGDQNAEGGWSGSQEPVAGEDALGSGTDGQDVSGGNGAADSQDAAGNQAAEGGLDAGDGTGAAGEPAADGLSGLSAETQSGTPLLPVSPFFLTDDADLGRKVFVRLGEMSLEDKVAQLFVVTPEALAGSREPLTAAGDGLKAAFDRFPVGGFIYMGANLVDQEQTVAMLSAVQSYSRERLGLSALACVDEEGGTVARISGTGKFRVPTIGDMSQIGKKNDPDRAFDTGVKIGTYLHELGFNVDFAPVADVLTNPDNQVVKLRSFGKDPYVVSNMAASVAYGLASQQVLGTYKHFPGHGATEADTHQGYAYTERTKEQLQESELVPFQDGITRGIPFIMVAHISLPNVTGDDTPASLSPVIINGILRREMGYDGIVITDALNMGAVVQEYSSAETAVKALLAGADILLMPENFMEAYQGVLDAVADGTLTEERIDESVTRILKVKLGLLEDNVSQ